MMTRVPFLPGVHLPQTYWVCTLFMYSATMAGMSTSLLYRMMPSQPMKADRGLTPS